MQKITKEVYLDWYENMMLWRKFEDKLAAVYIPTKSKRVSPLVQRSRSRTCRRFTCDGFIQRQNDHCLSKSRSTHWDGR